MLEWVATSFSRGSFQPRDRTALQAGSLLSEPPGKSEKNAKLCPSAERFFREVQVGAVAGSGFLKLAKDNCPVPKLLFQELK